METLWAPWRLDYLEAKKSEDGCVLCTIPQKPNDKENLILWRGEHSFVIMNRYPYNCGHVMVVMHKHTDSLHGLTKGEQAELIWATGECIRILKEVMGSHASNSGMNIGHDAGAGIIGHLHMHVVPRWRGDNNFFPIIADTKSLPEYLAKTYEKLHPAFEKLSQ